MMLVMFMTLTLILRLTATRRSLMLHGIRIATTHSSPRTTANGSAQNSAVLAANILTDCRARCATQCTTQNRPRINRHGSAADSKQQKNC
jgi:hypothetical protein